MKIIYILFAGLCLLSCEKTKIEDVIREVEPDQPSSIHYYYSYKAGEVINAEKLGYASGEFMPGCTYIYGDTLSLPILKTNISAWNYTVCPLIRN